MSSGFRFTWTDLHSFNAGQIAIARLSNYGVRLPTTCRLLEAMRRIEGSILGDAGTAHLSDDDRVNIESHRVLLEFYIITSALRGVKGVQAQRLASAVCGRFSDDFGLTTKARDAQFELLVAALIHHSGIKDLVAEEPDLTIAAGSRRIGVAAKRISSEGQLRKRLSGALRQLRKLGDYGVIALNMDQILARVVRREGHQAAETLFHATVQKSNSLVRLMADQEYVAGIQAFCTLFVKESIGGKDIFSLHCLTHGHWVGPEEDQTKLDSFLTDRGAQLEYRLQQLMSRVF